MEIKTYYSCRTPNSICKIQGSVRYSVKRLVQNNDFELWFPKTFIYSQQHDFTNCKSVIVKILKNYRGLKSVLKFQKKF